MVKVSFYTFCCSILAVLKGPVFASELVVLPRIGLDIPGTDTSIDNLSHISTPDLAASHFNHSGPIDMLVGAGLFPQIIRDYVKHLAFANSLFAIDTVLALMVMGHCNYRSTLFSSSHFLLTVIDRLDSVPVEDLLEQFWELEQGPENISDDKSSEASYASVLILAEMLWNSHFSYLRHFHPSPQKWTK